uniref:Secreted protein n=1 Tax=Ixodes ricinus TaxID=34613 RepID=A0A147BF17_IXORI
MLHSLRGTLHLLLHVGEGVILDVQGDYRDVVEPVVRRGGCTARLGKGAATPVPRHAVPRLCRVLRGLASLGRTLGLFLPLFSLPLPLQHGLVHHQKTLLAPLPLQALLLPLFPLALLLPLPGLSCLPGLLGLPDLLPRVLDVRPARRGLLGFPRRSAATSSAAPRRLVSPARGGGPCRLLLFARVSPCPRVRAARGFLLLPVLAVPAAGLVLPGFPEHGLSWGGLPGLASSPTAATPAPDAALLVPPAALPVAGTASPVPTAVLALLGTAARRGFVFPGVLVSLSVSSVALGRDDRGLRRLNVQRVLATVFRVVTLAIFSLLEILFSG